MDIFLGSSQNWASLRVISMHFRVCSKGQCIELGYFLGCQNFKYFFWVLEIPDIFLG